ncbi:MAG TPA: hypothetical protein VL334_07015 [Anaerolineae bacterium]|nr:hypothetical protein [Anaerolineae bacterium]
MNLDLRLTANIRVSPDHARRSVSQFVGNHIADLLYGDQPDLIIRADGAYWRVPVVLSSKSLGRIGVVGSLDVNVENGDLRVSERILSEIEHNAQRFASGAAL